MSMRVLALETSCDETGVAVVGKEKGEIKVLSARLASQTEIHREYGGIHPTLALREHKKNLPLLFRKTKEEADPRQWDRVAVTVGPGLEPCLWQGLNFARKLGRGLGLPVAPVDHMEAHILVNFVDQVPDSSLFPAVCLLVSGGHTQLVLMKKVGDYRMLGETRDDAAGECFDKTARMLGLPYPGGPPIAAKAHRSEDLNIELPRPMMGADDYDFSFSGLKTAVLYRIRDAPQKVRESEEFVQAMAYEIQAAITEVLVKKTVKAVEDFKAKSIILGGGVSANRRLRQDFRARARTRGISLLLPPKNLATDNAVMVGVAALLRPGKRIPLEDLEADPDMRLGKE